MKNQKLHKINQHNNHVHIYNGRLFIGDAYKMIDELKKGFHKEKAILKEKFKESKKILKESKENKEISKKEIYNYCLKIKNEK